MVDTFARMRQLTGTTAEWAANDLVIGLGELAIEIVSAGVHRMKLGDGARMFSALPYYDPGVGTFVMKAGDTMTGLLTTPGFNVPDGGTASAPTVVYSDASRNIATTAFVKNLLATRGQGDAIYRYGGATLGTPAAGAVIIDPGTDPVRQFALSETDADGVGRFLTLLQPGDSLVITNEVTPVTYYARYDLVSTVTDHGAWVEFTAHLITFSGIAEAPPLNTRLKLTGYLNLATGDGPILGVTAGDNLTGGGNVGVVTLAVQGSPAFTGTPTAPTAAAGTNTTQLATTAFVTTAASTSLRLVSEAVSTGASGVLAVTFPAAAKIVELHWDCTVNPAANNAWSMVGMAGSTPQTAAKYSVSNLLQTATTVAGGFVAAQAGWQMLGGEFRSWGHATFQQPQTGIGFVNFAGITMTGTRQQTTAAWETDGTMTPFDGFRINCSPGNMLTGSYLRCFALV